MAEKDIVEKQLESYPDVMADILNVIIYQGREVVKGEDLFLLQPGLSLRLPERYMSRSGTLFFVASRMASP